MSGPLAPNIISLEAERTLKSLHEVLAIIKAFAAEPVEAEDVEHLRPSDSPCGEGA